MYVKNYRELPVEVNEVEGLSIRWGITALEGASNFSMRLLELAPLKSTPLHKHESEHEMFVLVGRGEVVTENGIIPIREGSVIFVAPNEVHQFRNTGASALRFVDAVMFPSESTK